MTYVTKSGDMWDLIARQKLGSEKFTADLMRANPDLLDTEIFRAGVEIVLPEIEKKKSTKLPPWKS